MALTGFLTIAMCWCTSSRFTVVGRHAWCACGVDVSQVTVFDVSGSGTPTDAWEVTLTAAPKGISA
jgi:hypothetical protein